MPMSVWYHNYKTNQTDQVLLLHQHYYIMARVLALRWIVCFQLALLVIAGRVETDHVVMAAAVVTSYYLTTTRWNWVVSRWTMQQ
jgi:hypothetical protein